MHHVKTAASLPYWDKAGDEASAEERVPGVEQLLAYNVVDNILDEEGTSALLNPLKSVVASMLDSCPCAPSVDPIATAPDVNRVLH